MKKIWHDEAWKTYVFWQNQDKKTLKRINRLLKDIDRNGYRCTGKPEPLKGNLSGYWSVRIDKKKSVLSPNRLRQHAFFTYSSSVGKPFSCIRKAHSFASDSFTLSILAASNLSSDRSFISCWRLFWVPRFTFPRCRMYLA